MTETLQMIDAPLAQRPGGPQDIMQLLKIAVAKDVPSEDIKTLSGILERQYERAAAEEFAGALTRFRKACPELKLLSEIKAMTDSGSKIAVRYARYGEIDATVRPHLEREQLRYKHDWEVYDQNGQAWVKTTCTLLHVSGQSDTSSIALPVRIEAKGKEFLKDEVKRIEAVVTVGKRMTLAGVLGIPTEETPDQLLRDMDTSPISTEQAAQIKATLRQIEEDDDAQNVDMPRFLKWNNGVESVEEIPQSRYESATAFLRDKLKNAAERRAWKANQPSVPDQAAEFVEPVE